MVIDQRNAGASITPTNLQYSVDRWFASVSQASKFTMQQNAGSVTPPTGFSNYLGCTSSSAYSVGAADNFNIGQKIEGYNFADMAWGTADAKTVTLSFWVRSSLTGSFGASVFNNATNRSYPFSYTINSANTWEYKTVTIPGDTTGTWVGATNGIGLYIYWSLGSGSNYNGTANTWAGALYLQPSSSTSVVGTNGATWYITGVQLEVGPSATSFDYRPYGTELALCQRYFQIYKDATGGPTFTIAQATSTSAVGGGSFHFSEMRAAPTGTFSGNWYIRNSTGDSDVLTSGLIRTAVNYGSINGTRTNSGLTAGHAAQVWTDGGSITLSAEI
jgi:hypothetical protein